MHETDIVLGEIQVRWLIHGGAAINCLVFLYENPSDWIFKQFTSDAEMRQYATENHLRVVQQRQE